MTGLPIVSTLCAGKKLYLPVVVSSHRLLEEPFLEKLIQKPQFGMMISNVLIPQWASQDV